MFAVITGDIIRSRKSEASIWMAELKEMLNQYGNNPYDWEMYRGDSFQLITPPMKVLHTACILKAGIKKMKNMDVRIGIGIGDIQYRAEKVTESNGTAFINSGNSFDSIKKQTLSIKTPWNDFDEKINIMLNLATLTMDRWSEKTAEIILIKFREQDLSQKEIATLLHKKGQGNISEALKRGGYDEIMQFIEYYQKRINHYDPARN